MNYKIKPDSFTYFKTNPPANCALNVFVDSNYPVRVLILNTKEMDQYKRNNAAQNSASAHNVLSQALKRLASKSEEKYIHEFGRPIFLRGAYFIVIENNNPLEVTFDYELRVVPLQTSDY